MHTLIIGQTESGKTCLAKMLAKLLRKHKKKVVILDPMVDPHWDCDELFENGDELGAYLRMPENRSTYVFVDECGTVFNEGRDLTHAWLATKSRHYGHSVSFIAQRAVQVPSTMRFQCNRMYCFTSSRKDGLVHSEEWNKDILITVNRLPQYHFYMVDRFVMCERYQIKNWKDIVKVAQKALDPSSNVLIPPVPDSDIEEPEQVQNVEPKTDKVVDPPE